MIDGFAFSITIALLFIIHVSPFVSVNYSFPRMADVYTQSIPDVLTVTPKASEFPRPSVITSANHILYQLINKFHRAM